MKSNTKDIIEFTLFYNRFKVKIFNYVFKMVNNRMLTEDIVQTVFMRLYENLDFIRNKESVQFWLFRTARNEVYTYYRGKKSKVDQFKVLDSNELELVSENSLINDIELKDVKKHVMKKLDQMSFDQREVYILKEYGELSYKEIASVMNISEDLVKSRLFKIRRKLIESLSKVVI